ncbi:calcium-binding protein 39-like [Sycon ciliatum]|uniref:calcium-binding protein 39-like n=1 Tax=Sycon ciliatum TaxID=27933 RepID=UPI0020A87988|eukprot:scpid10261/ scgid11605/ Calcium-binding protein 39; MO25alpha; Protein Mo25 &gt; Calcium-binding protein 39; MO25alpha; Protein Mo25
MPFFKSSKSPTDVVKATREALTAIEKGDGGASKKAASKASEEATKGISGIKLILFGTPDSEPHAESVVQLSQEVYHSNLLVLLISCLERMDFESRKDIVLIFNNLLRRNVGGRQPTVEYIISSKPEIIGLLFHGYENPSIALNCGMMMRECVRYEQLAKLILKHEDFFCLFKLVELPTFDIASDAFSTLRELLTRHKVLAAEFLEKHYDQVFSSYDHLLHSENYVTKRQSLKLLGELLLDRHNFATMSKYISNVDNLKQMMNLLRDKSRNIQYEAFHVFKVFVANPNKNKLILDILLKNREKLIDFLGRFHNDRSEDEQFTDEKAYLIKQIQELQQPAESK